MTKLKTLENLKPLIEELKSQNKKIVTTNGTYDILHSAHLRLLQKAKSLGDILIVLINSDSSVKQNKGPLRPILPELERAEHLSHLASVDYILIFPEQTPLDYLKELKPHFHIKGGSWDPEKIKEEKTLLESWGGEFKTFELEENYSTTNIINKILQIHKK